MKWKTRLSLDCDDEFCSGSRKVSLHYRGMFPGLLSPVRSDYIITYYQWIHSIYCIVSCVGGCLDQNMDVAIVGDISKSMKSDHRSKLIVLVKSLVDKMGVSREGNHFAIASFGPYAAINTNFNNQNNYEAENLKRVVNQRFRVVPTKVGTRTDLILQKVNTALFTPAGGDRPDAKNIMFIFTDGEPWIGKWDKRKMIPFEDSTKALEVLSLNPYLTLIWWICQCSILTVG